MDDFKERMCQEHNELRERLGKLNVALCMDGFREKVGDYQFKLMKEQALGMEKYFIALTARMKDMGLCPNDEGTSCACTGMGIGGAVDALKLGLAVRRKGWNGKGMFVVLMNRENPCINYNNQLLLVQKSGIADSWTASSSDVFADDWEIAND
nr:MAG TPA: Protein of unknown function (DUF2829) [Caudoviricetes sp.]